MGNCTSKKSAKLPKIRAASKKIFHFKMEKDQEIHPKGASKKVVPFTKGEIKSFGLKKKIPSQLPIPVTLTSNHISNTLLDIHENNNNNVTKQNNSSEGYQSGSSVESLCHAPSRATPKVIQKKNTDHHANQQSSQKSSNIPSKKENNLAQEKSRMPRRTSFPSSRNSIDEQHPEAVKNLLDSSINRFGFRQSIFPRATNLSGKNTPLPPSQNVLSVEQRPQHTNSPYANPSKTQNFSTRSRSEGSRDGSKKNLKTFNSKESGLNDSESFLSNELQPKKFTLQTSHLPKPQFPVKMFDTKTAKTAANYYRKEGIHKELKSSKGTNSLMGDYAIESRSIAENTLQKGVEILDNSPGTRIRRSLPSHKGKKLELKVVGNKFELLADDKEESNVVTEISFIKLPSYSSTKCSTAVINTGLVEERTNQYLRRISHPFVNPKKEFDENYRIPARNSTYLTAKRSESECGRWDDRLGVESEEEKLSKDSRKSEKFLTDGGFSEVDDIMLPGEAMAEDESICVNFEDDLVPSFFNKKSDKTCFQSTTDEAPNTIRLDALRLSKELKYKNFASFGKNDQPQTNGRKSSIVVHLANGAQDEETFPSESILEPLSSDSDSFGDKGENKNNDKEKNFKVRGLNLSLEDLEDEIKEMVNGEDVEVSDSKSGTDVEDDELERNIDKVDADKDKVDMEKHNICLEKSNSPHCPGTPTDTSNSLSLSDGRDFLIDDEIADQPQLYFSNKFMEMVSREEEKTSNDKSLMPTKESDACSETKMNSPGKADKAVKNIGSDVATDFNVYGALREKMSSRLNTDGTLSPCDSIASDDLMLDFESNPFEDTVERLNALNNRNGIIGAHEDENQNSVSSQIFHTRSECIKSPIMKEGSCHGILTKNHFTTTNAQDMFRSLEENDDFVKIDRISYQDVFQDVVSMKTMLLNLKCLLSESEGNLQENYRSQFENGLPNNQVEDELADLRRQVLFLQQQLEEREKTVQILKLKVNKTLECTYDTGTTESRTQCNAATQTGLDQYQRDFTRLRLFRTTPVV